LRPALLCEDIKRRLRRWTAQPNLVLFNGRITTLHRQNPDTVAVAIRAGRSCWAF